MFANNAYKRKNNTFHHWKDTLGNDITLIDEINRREREIFGGYEMRSDLNDA